MGTILADGQCHYAFHVETAAGHGERVVERIEVWKGEARARPTHDFGVQSVPELCDRVRAIPGVTRVLTTGPRSALPLAQRMACGLTGRRGVLGSHTGRGPLSEAIRTELASWNIDLLNLRDVPGDMPAAFMVYDPAAPNANFSAEIRPLSSTRYRHSSVYEPALLQNVDGFLLQRVNEGVLDVARTVHGYGKPICLRIHGYSRFVSFEDYRSLFPLVDHLVLDDGHHVLRDTARALGLNPPKGWPVSGSFQVDFLKDIAKAIDAIAGKPLLHAYHVAARGCLYVFGTAGCSIVRLQPVVPAGLLCDRRSTARTHGALLGAVLANKPEFDLDPASFQPQSEEGLDRFSSWAFRAAHQGILNVPWRWPDTAFDPARLQPLVP